MHIILLYNVLEFLELPPGSNAIFEILACSLFFSVDFLELLKVFFLDLLIFSLLLLDLNPILVIPIFSSTLSESLLTFGEGSNFLLEIVVGLVNDREKPSCRCYSALYIGILKSILELVITSLQLF